MRWGVRRWAVVLVSSMAVASAGCKHTERSDKPEQAVARWIDAMEHLRQDPANARAAFDLLSASARANLKDRARRASAATGQQMAPESMLVPSRFQLRFPVRSMTAHVAGKRAIVEVKGAHQRADVPCVKEHGKWRVDLMIPALPAVEKRPDAGL